MAGSMSNRDLRPETIAAHALKAIDEATGAVVPPIYMSTTYARDETYTPRLRENYVRNGNPTLWQAEEAIAALEKRKEAEAMPRSAERMRRILSFLISLEPPAQRFHLAVLGGPLWPLPPTEEEELLRQLRLDVDQASAVCEGHQTN